MKRQQLEGKSPKAKRSRISDVATMEYLKEGDAFEQDLGSKEFDLNGGNRSVEKKVKKKPGTFKNMWTTMQQPKEILGKLVDKL